MEKLLTDALTVLLNVERCQHYLGTIECDSLAGSSSLQQFAFVYNLCPHAVRQETCQSSFTHDLFLQEIAGPHSKVLGLTPTSSSNQQECVI